MMKDTAIQQKGDLPVGWVLTTLGDIWLDLHQGIMPNKYFDEEFELYSVPRFVLGKPEFVFGKDIGSNKQIVKKNAVLLCKINPRINRVWIVGDYSNFKKIASTEWIPFFQIKELHLKYLSYFLQNLCRDTRNNNIVRKTFCNDCTSGNNTIISDLDPIENRYLCTNPAIRPNANSLSINTLFSYQFFSI